MPHLVSEVLDSPWQRKGPFRTILTYYPTRPSEQTILTTVGSA